MSFYLFSCPDCGEFEVEMPMSKYRHLDTCPTCEKHRPDRVWSVPNFNDGKGLDVKLPGINIDKSVSGATQEARYANKLRNARRLAWDKRQYTKHARKGDGEVRMLAQIPRELEVALTRSTGNKQIVREEFKKIVKKYDLGVDSG